MPIRSTTEEEVGITSRFGGSVSSEERELAIDDGVSGSSAVPDLQFFLDLDVVVREGEECVRRSLAEVEASVGRAEEASGGDSLVDIMAVFEKDSGGESEVITFGIFSNVQIYCQRL